MRWAGEAGVHRRGAEVGAAADSYPEHQDQHRRTLNIIEIRQAAFTTRHGQAMPENNIWLRERRRELDSLTAIITALETADRTTAHGATARTDPKEGR